MHTQTRFIRQRAAAELRRYTARMAHRGRKLVSTQVDIGSQVDSSLSN
jgi:hypothetical protein